MAGKGDAPRPKSVDNDEWSRRWDKIFKKKKKKTKKQVPKI